MPKPATAEDYTAEAQALLPTGPAWNRAPASTLTGLLAAKSVEWARVHNRGVDLLAEMNPLTSVEMLDDWERVCGLPDNCQGDISTVEGRRAAVLSRLKAQGGASPGYFIELAAGYGYEIEITEYRPFRAGFGRAGDPLTGEDWAYAWTVTTASDTIRPFRAGRGRAGEPLREWGNEALECLISKYKPSHTVVIFAYSGDPIII